jgi:hypothetical protein
MEKGTIIKDTLQNNEYNKDLSMRPLNQCKYNKKHRSTSQSKIDHFFFHITESKQRKSQNFSEQHK